MTMARNPSAIEHHENKQMVHYYEFNQWLPERCVERDRKLTLILAVATHFATYPSLRPLHESMISYQQACAQSCSVRLTKSQK